MKKNILLSNFFLLILSFLFSFQTKAQNCHCDHTVTLTQDPVVDGKKLNVQPGDTVCLQAGKRPYLWLQNFTGTAEKPIVFINCGGQVVISNTDKWGISVSYSKHIKLLGNGDPSIKYGIKVDGVATVGMSFNRLTTDFEVGYVEVYKSLGPALIAKTDPECGKPETWKDNFVMRNVNVHHLYAHDVGTKAAGGEGFYIGHSFFNGIDTSCGKLFPHNIENIQVHHNIVENTAFDGIQVSCAVSGCEVYNNSIKNYGMLNNGSQQTGLVIGGGSKGKFYNNKVDKGTGAGVTVFGQGDVYFFNNIVSNTDQDGIFCDDRTTDPTLGFHFWNNTIINAKLNGITMYSALSTGNTFYNNLIVNPGNWPKFWDYKRAFIYLENIPGKVVKFDTANNAFYKDLTSAKLQDPANLDFHLTSASPAIDKGKDLSLKGVTFDFDNQARFFGKTFDIGAFEFKSSQVIPPSMIAKVTATNVTCYGLSNGKATATVTGGTAPYAYSWSNGKSTSSIDLLSNGIYTVVVTDSKGSKASADFTITQPSAISVTGSKTDVGTANAGAIDLTVSGGISPYAFSWSTGATTEDLSGLAAGSYSVSVTDKNGCTSSASFTITQTNSGIQGIYNIVSKHTGRYMDVAGASTADNANVVVWDKNNAANQQWKIESTGDGYYKITSVHSSKALDVLSGNINDGTNIVQNAPATSDCQRWSLVDLGGGYYKIVSKCSGRGLQVKDGSTTKGAQVVLWTYWGGDYQKWRLDLVATTSLRTEEIAKDINLVEVYPNPVGAQGLNVVIQAENETPGKFTIKNSLGQEEASVTQDLKKGSNIVHLETQRLGKGVHFLVISYGSSRTTKKILIEE